MHVARSGAHLLHSAGRGLEQGQVGQGVHRVPSEFSGHGVDRGQVGRVELANQPGVEVLSLEVELQSAQAVLHDAGFVVGHLMGAIGDDAGSGALHHGVTVPRIGVGQGEGGGGEFVEERLLGSDVRVEIPVVIEVVVGDVREDPARQLGPGQAVLVQCVRARFHEAMRAPGIEHVGEELLQADRIRCGVRGGNHPVHNAVLHGADQAGLSVKHAGEPVEEGGHRGLAVGAGDGDDLEALGRVVVEVGGEVAEGGPAVFHLDVDDLITAVVLRGHAFAHDGGGSGAYGTGDVLVAVHRGAGNGDEAAEWLDLPAVGHHGFHRDVGGSGDLGDPRSVEDVLEQLHDSSRRMVWPLRGSVPGARLWRRTVPRPWMSTRKP